MIQRQQSLWLLLVAICAFLTFKFPFFAGGSSNATATIGGAIYVDAGSSLFLLISTGAIILLSLVTIFLFKDRKLQLNLCIVGIILSILTIVFYFVEIKTSVGAIALYSIFAFLMPVAYIMAARGIYKDQKLIKSLNKLR